MIDHERHKSIWDALEIPDPVERVKQNPEAAAFYIHHLEAQANRVCEWMYDPDTGNAKTACGKLPRVDLFDPDTFCFGCGGKVEIAEND